ncbi:MAG: hypothetical protein MI746_05230, partial [Pseudomonadales bacterium]|nr:hypothetical protein [Pseudomonadales bacterium]
SNAKRKLLSKPKVIDLAAESSDANRGISCSIDPGKYPLQLSQYRMGFFGTKIGVGSLSIRL